MTLSASTFLTIPRLADAHPADDPKPTESSETDARMALVVARFGKHLDAEARKAIRADVEAIVNRAALLRKFPLSNGDQPYPTFAPYREPDRPRDEFP
jgi:hypothetical protein